MIAVELLQLTYLHRTQPEVSVELVLNPTQIAVLKAKTKSSKLPKILTIAWAVEAVARARRLSGTSPSNSDWYASALARLVETARPL